MNKGHVYFLVNPSMPGLLKIGFTTTTLQQRLADLETTGVPEPFVVGAAFLVSDPPLCERKLHELFHAKRRMKKREFFEMSLSEALSQAMPVVQSMLASEDKGTGKNTQESPKLSFEEGQMLCMLVHDPKGKPIQPEYVAREHCVHIQKVLLACANLLDMGLLQEHRERGYDASTYSLTHKGRKYCFDHNIVIQEIIAEKPER